MSVDFRDIPKIVWDFLDEKMGQPVKCSDPWRALVIAVGWNPPLMNWDEELTSHGVAAFVWNEQRRRPPVEEGKTFTRDEVPPEFRDRGKANGKPLTVKYLEDSPRWELKGPYLKKHYGPGKALTTHIKVGRAKVYLYRELKALREQKTAKNSDTIHG